MKIGEWLSHAKETLAQSGCPDPHIDSKWIIEDTLKLTRTQLHFEADRVLTDEELSDLNNRLARRVKGEPVQYILNSACFMGLSFYVDDRVLIPRQDTETLVENVVASLHQQDTPAVLDMCTGSGAIGISIKTLLPDAQVTLTDISKDALEVARKNAKLLNVEVDVRQGDLYKAVGNDTFDIIVSNPPYIPRQDLAILQYEVRFEPAIALDGGIDGLDLYRRIAQEAKAHLKPGGSIFLEVGMGEAQDVLALLRNGMECAESGCIKDLNGIERIVWARSV